MNKVKELDKKLGDIASVVLILAIGAYGVFVLPYSFPLKVPVSDTPSYAVGFNNRIAALVIVAVIGLLFARNLWWRRRAPEPVESVFWTGAESDKRAHLGMPVSVLVFFIVAYTVTTCFLYTFIPRLDDYAEGPNWIPRIKLALAYNLHPYRDFEFAYGPLMWYIPEYILAITSGLFGASYNLGYLLSLIIMSAFALWALFYLVDHFHIRAEQRIIIFSIISLASYDWSFNVAGTLVRYAGPFMVALMMHKALSRVEVRSDARTVTRLCAIPLLSAIGVLSISQEFGFIYVIGQSAYFLHRIFFQNRLWGYSLLSTIACLPIWLVLFPGSLDRVLSSGNCFSHLPIMPAIYIIFYILSLVWVVPILLRTCATLSPRKNAEFMLLWAIMLVAVVPASLGRCEHHHCSKNGLGAFLIALPILASFRPRMFTIYAASFALVFDVVWRVVDIVDVGGNLQPVRLALGGALQPAKPETNGLAGALGLHGYKSKSIAIPMGVDRETRYYLIESGRLAPQYFMGYGSVASQVELDQKIAELKNAEYLIVPKEILGLRGLTDAQVTEARWKQQPQVDLGQSVWLGTLFLLPMNFKTKYLPFDPWIGEGRYIADHYDAVREGGGYVLMKPK